MLPSDCLNTADECMKAFHSTADLWFGRLSLSTKVVAVGLVFEAPELVCEIYFIIRREYDNWKLHITFPERHPPDVVRVIAFLGWFLIVGGVLGEWFTEGKFNEADTNIQQLNDVLRTEAIKEAGDARISASEAKGDAKGAKEISDKAKASAANSMVLAKGARQEADSFEEDIKTAKQRAAEAESHLADALERAAKATRELEKLKTPRSLGEEQQARIVSKIKRFPETPFDLWVNTDSDSTALMELIDAMLRSAGWKFNSTGSPIEFASKAGVIATSGISIHVPQEYRSEWGNAVIVLRDALKAEGIPAVGSWDSIDIDKDKKRDRIHVMIGSKPLN